MSEPFAELRAEIDSIPVVDAHQHLRSHEQSQPSGDVVGFLTGAYLGSMLPSADRALAARAMDASLGESDRWQSFLKLWKYVRCTGYGNVVTRILANWGLDEQLTAQSLDGLRERLQERSPEASREAYGKAGIESTVTHYLAHPSCGGLENVAEFLDGALTFGEHFHPLLGTLPLHEFMGKAGLETLARVCESEIGSLDQLTASVETLTARVIDLGVVGLKDHAAYSRGLSFGLPDRAGAEEELQRLLKGEEFPEGARRLSDYVFHHLVKLSIEHRLPIAIHTGYLVGCSHPKANVRHFTPILEAYPEARFDLYHLNYPWAEDLLAVLKRFPNTWANCCWTHIIDPEATVTFLRQALGAVPANHVFGFGGDFVTLPEAVIAHLEIARDNVAAALAESVAHGRCSKSAAIEVARLWLYESPRAFYGL